MLSAAQDIKKKRSNIQSIKTNNNDWTKPIWLLYIYIDILCVHIF
jgi:hypothetical protein